MPLLGCSEETLLLKYTLLCVLVAFAFAGIAVADNEITLDLETPSLQQPTTQAKPSVSSSNTNSTKSEKSTVASVRGKTSDTQVIGRVGVVNAEKAKIYAKKSTKSKVYSTCAKETTLAIVKESGPWYGILMVDGSTGWIQSEEIKLLDYSAVLPKTDANNRGQLPSRGEYDGRSYSNNPVIQTALQYLGSPYVYGGTSTSSGIDCSAFVRMVFSQFGVKLPRTAREQSNVGTPVVWDDVQPGDRLYFACKHNYPDHCGIYMGNGYFVHASASRGGVAVDEISTKLYSKSLVAIMR
jgi:cell wall-associated NlpC family hydrolase